jgi:hypothetical protein
VRQAISQQDLNMRLSAAIALISLTALAGCAGNGEPVEAEKSDAGFDREQELERRMEVRRELGNKLPAQVPDEPRVPIVGEVPDSILSAAKEDLAAKLDVAAESIGVREAASVVWNDGSLGCPRPGQVYTQALEPGYRIILEHGDRQYDYRATERGYFFLCELPTLPRRPENLQKQ